MGVGEAIIPSSLLNVENLVYLWGRLLLRFGKIDTNLKLCSHCQPECRSLFWFSIGFGDRDGLFVPFFIEGSREELWRRGAWTDPCGGDDFQLKFGELLAIFQSS